MSFQPVINVATYVYADRFHRLLFGEELLKAGHTDDKAMEVSRKLFPKSGGLLQVQSATDAFVQFLRESLVTIVTVDRVTKVLIVSHASCPATTTGTEPPPRFTETELSRMVKLH